MLINQMDKLRKLSVIAGLTTILGLLGSIEIAEATVFNFIQTGWEGGGTLTGFFEGEDLNGDGQIITIEEISNYGATWSGNSIVPGFTHTYQAFSELGYNVSANDFSASNLVSIDYSQNPNISVIASYGGNCQTPIINGTPVFQCGEIQLFTLEGNLSTITTEKAVITVGNPGDTPNNPILPNNPNPNVGDPFIFDNIPNDVPDEIIFIDPDVAVGYDYLVNSGPNIASVLLPDGIGDNLYDLWLFNNGLGDYEDTGIDLMGGQLFNFSSGGVDRFRILGIETEAMLDPTDPTAFVTGLTFVDTGSVSMQMTPITENVADTSVPEPRSIISLLAIAILGIGSFAKRKISNSY